MSGLQDAQWIRQANLIVSKTVDPKSELQPGLDLSEFRFRFEIRQQDDKTPNTAVIRVFNVSDKTATQIKNEFTRVTIQAGYKHTSVGIIFDGSIVQTRSGRERNVDSYLDILAAQGDIPFISAIANQTIAGPASADQISQAIGKTLEPYGYKMGDTSGLVGGTLPRGKVLFGLALNYFNQVTETRQYTWTFHDGKVIPIPLKGYLPGDVVVLNSQSGLIGQPEATQQGIQVVCLINPKIHVGLRVQIDNKSINQTNNRNVAFSPNYINPFDGAFASVTDDGIYRVIVMDIEGDTRGQPWYQKITCLALDPSAKPDNAVKQFLQP